MNFVNTSVKDGDESFLFEDLRPDVLFLKM